MKTPSIDDALEFARQALSRPVEEDDRRVGWDEDYCRGWLLAVDAIERFVRGDHTGRHWSIVRSLDSHGSDAMDHPRGEALMNLAAVLRRNGIDHFA